MAALLLPLAIVVAAGAAQGALLLEDNFSYATGQLTTVSGGNWAAVSGAGVNPIMVSSGSLSYSGYPSSGAGNKIEIIGITTTAEDDARAFSQSVTAGAAAYVALLVRVADTVGMAANASTTGDYFAAQVPSATTSYHGRLSVRKGATGNSYQLGLRASSSNTAATWVSSDLAPGETHLIVVRYQLIAGDANDSVALFVDPSLAGAEPTPDIIQVSALVAEPTDIGRIVIRQGSAGTPNASIDGIRAGTSWDDVRGVLPVNPEVMAVSPANNATGVMPNAAISVTFDRLMDAATVNGSSFAVTGRLQPVYAADSIRPAANSKTFTFYPDSLRKGDTVTVTLGTAIADTGGNPLLSPYVWQFYTIVPETIRPYLVSSVPANGASRIDVSTTVRLTFSEALDPATADTAAFELLGRRQAKYQLAAPVLSSGNTVVTLSPADSFFYRDTITVRVKPALTDVSGNAIRDTSIGFSTRTSAGLQIYDVQYSLTGDSPYAGQTVTVTGVVTAVVAGGYSDGTYYVQDGPGPWNGVYVYGRYDGAQVGDSVRITGAVSEYYNLTEITTSSFTRLKAGCALPAAAPVTTGGLSASGEQYEGVLVTTGPVSVTSVATGTYDGYAINDGSGVCAVGNFIGTYTKVGYSPVVGDMLIKVQGITNYGRINSSSNSYGIEPRSLGDVIDTKPIKLLSTIPANGDTGAATYMLPVTLLFSKPALTDSLIPSHFRLQGSRSGAMPFTVMYDSAAWTCLLVPDRSFANAETITVWISHSLMDTSGHTLDGNGNGVSVNDSTDDYSFSFTTLADVLTIGEVQRPGPDGYGSAMAGQHVLIQGVLTGPAQYFSSSTWSSSAGMYIQDNTSGANIFAGSITMADPRINKLGMLCVVYGQVTEYSGVTEITTDASDMRFWGYAPRLPRTDTLIYNQFLTEDMEGKLMEVEGSISSPPAYAGGGYNMELRNGDAPIAVRFSEVSGFPMAQLTNGQKIHLVGIVSQYDKYAPFDAGYQIVPRFGAPYTYNGVTYPADITLLADSIAPLGSAEIVGVTPNPFCPDWGEALAIDLNGPLTDRLTLRVYDLKGRLVKTLLNSVPGGHQVCRWDGTDNGHRRAGIGMYVLHLRSVSTDGQVRGTSRVVVLGTPLK
jgi:DNA/RNA endonuclease YhcR with UshA esterase domain